MIFENKIIHCGDVVENVWNNVLDRCGKPQELPLKTLPQLSKKMWGLKRQKLVVVGGRTSNGKSVFLLQVAWDLLQQGKTIVFFSYEMSYTVCIERIISMACQLDNWHLTTGQIKLEIEKYPVYQKRVEALIKELKEKNLILVDGIGRSLPTLNEVLEILPAGVDVVIIDYGNLIDDVPGKSKKQSYDDFLKGLRALAIKKNFCALIASQVNRNVYSKDGIVRIPSLADLKETGELEQLADMVIMCHYPYAHDKNKDKNDYLLSIAKNRDGRVGDFWCKFYPECFKIEEISAAPEDCSSQQTNETTPGAVPLKNI